MTRHWSLSGIKIETASQIPPAERGTRLMLFICGATGATGRLLTARALQAGHKVRVVVRSAERLPSELAAHEGLEVIEADLLSMSAADLKKAVGSCRAVASCLGHNLTFSGIYGQPRRLVSKAVEHLSSAIEEAQENIPVRFVLMNTAGCHITAVDHSLPVRQRAVLSIMRHLVPPLADNEEAVMRLVDRGNRPGSRFEWCVVRPDSLVDHEQPGEYSVFDSPQRSAVFDAGQTSRHNVAAFMLELMTTDTIWQQWRSKYPVIYNRDSVYHD